MNNAVITIDGNLVRDPEIKQVGVNNVCNYTVAVNTDTKKEDGTYDANFYDCSTWGGSGDYIFSKIKKGTEVTVCGEFSAIEKPDANGNMKTRLRVKTYNVKVRRGARDAELRKEANKEEKIPVAKDDPTE